MGHGLPALARVFTDFIKVMIHEPESRKKLREEFSTLKIEELTLEHVEKLEFFQRCLSEILRKEPPVSITNSWTVSEASTSLGGVTLHPGETFHVAIRQTQQDPKEWKEPAAFIPDRFDHESHYMRKPGGASADASTAN